jgi:gluconate:H+ symporter, GntP family
MNLLAIVTDPLFILLIGILFVVGGIIGLRLHAFIALLLGAFAVALLTPASNIVAFGLASGMTEAAATQLSQRPIGARIATAFGNTAAQIGILIAMAAIIGRCLLESGGAERIVRSVLRVTGVEKSPIAFAGSSFVLGIPVFFDTVFYLMIPLAKAMAIRIRKNYILLVMMSAAGASMAGSLVPPTPGPLFLISEMNIPIHMMMIGGTIVGIFTVSSGYAYAAWANARWPTPVRDSLDAPLENMEALAAEDTTRLPPLWLSLLPIVIPLLFISAAGILETFVAGATPTGVQGVLLRALGFFGERNVALVTGGLVALALLARQKHVNREALTASMQAALSSGGVIILITAAGGAFGSMLQQTGVSMRIAELTAGYQMALIPLAFVITAVVRTAQGSATVSMITAAGIMAGMAEVGQLDFHHLYIGLSVACGSKLIPWMNDSGFWIVSKMSNLTEEETLKTFSVMQTIMGVAGLIIVMIGATLFPLL